MAQGRPPRRSGRKPKPATIDLEAQKNGEGTDAGSASVPSGDDGVTGESPASAAGAPKKPEEKSQDGKSSADSSSAPETPSADAGKDRPTAESTPDEGNGPAKEKTGEPPATEQADAAKEASDRTSRAAGTAGRSDAPADAHSPEKTSAGADTAPQTVPAAQPEGGGGRGFVAGLLGGVIVAAIVLALEAAGMLPSPRTGPTDKTSSEIADLGNTVDALKKSVADLKNAPPPAAQVSPDSVKALQDRVKSLSGELAQLKSSVPSSGAVGASDLSNLKAALDKAGSRIDDLSKTVSGLESGLSGLKSEVAKVSHQTGLAAIVAATALKSAIERGGPFAAELKVYERVAPSGKVPAGLRDLADAGVPSHSALVDGFSGVAQSILSAIRGNSAGTGLVDRLLNSARSVISVRPTGNAKGNEPAAIVGRMESRLKAGDLKGVVEEWSSLPQAGRKASQAFIDRVKKRMTALQAADSALQDAMASTDKQG